MLKETALLNIVGKGENAGYPVFSLFPTMLSMILENYTLFKAINFHTMSHNFSHNESLVCYLVSSTAPSLTPLSTLFYSYQGNRSRVPVISGFYHN